ncbi:hypothetical protein AMK68_04455 [candidate division KD3-62 bacterium DG_56]|uniref:Squalene cyclase C-terminal domain-containing protein n=1 Tax=candidate division KD3-62 bacterium DG_56 TaxID=1704032 RepID=A0A0S7XKZ4_9BACT|nr:MAG: hypothetical protein AMK68_04455 [candidate division KD3-62 bacterium DG_56]
MIANWYTLALLGGRARQLEPATEQALVSWIMHRNGGIGYLGVALMPPSARSDRWPADRWLASHELLSAFVSWRDRASTVVSWLWRQRDKEGLWDFGPISGPPRSLPLSENWRRAHRREHDWSTRVLSLLREYARSSRRLAKQQRRGRRTGRFLE